MLHEELIELVRSQIGHEKEILEAIDQLRRRKARPDADRICNYLLRKYAVDARDTIEDLHKLIEAEKVIQVDYKGNTSYRNASKWSRLQLYKNRPEGFVKEKLNSAMVAGAVAELVVEEPDYLDQGVPAYRLIEQLLDGISNPTSRKMVEDFLSKEVANGNITKLGNGNYSLVSTSDMTNATQQQTNHSNGETKTKRRYSSENGDSGRESSTLTARHTSSNESYESIDGQNGLMNDSRSNTPRSSRLVSPRPDNGKREHDAALAVKNPNSPEESITKDDSMSRDSSRTSDSQRKHQKNDGANNSNLKRSSKSERKQRLMVRPDDSMDEIKFDEFDQREKHDRRRRTKEPDPEHASGDEKEDEETGRSSTNPSPTPSNPTGAFRSARRKRAKKVFDPSDNIVVKRRRGRQPGSGKAAAQTTVQETPEPPAKTVTKDPPSRQCSLCAKDKNETLVACRDCTVRAHPTCIYNPEELILKSGSAWQCERCKTCTICCETSEHGQLITCCNCDEAYHHSCHVPRVPSGKSHAKWQCSDCVQKQSVKANSIPVVVNSPPPPPPPRPETPCNQQPTLPPVLSPQVSPARDSIDQMDEEPSVRDGIDPNIPDASDWTSDQVYQYFARLFPKEAEVFRVQDIDGNSLLLMKRSDVLIGLDLLLGPALKIYRHVLKLQMRRDDTRYYWL